MRFGACHATVNKRNHSSIDRFMRGQLGIKKIIKINFCIKIQLKHY
jgi:hypothetical protein